MRMIPWFLGEGEVRREWGWIKWFMRLGMWDGGGLLERGERRERERVVHEDKVKLQGDPTTNGVSEIRALKPSRTVIDLFWFALFKSIELKKNIIKINCSTNY